MGTVIAHCGTTVVVVGVAVMMKNLVLVGIETIINYTAQVAFDFTVSFLKLYLPLTSTIQRCRKGCDGFVSAAVAVAVVGIIIMILC